MFQPWPHFKTLHLLSLGDFVPFYPSTMSYVPMSSKIKHLSRRPHPPLHLLTIIFTWILHRHFKFGISKTKLLSCHLHPRIILLLVAPMLKATTKSTECLNGELNFSLISHSQSSASFLLKSNQVPFLLFVFPGRPRSRPPRQYYPCICPL